MSTFQEIIASIQRNGTSLAQLIDPTEITNDTETGPYDNHALNDDKAWELARSIVSDSHRLISLLTPRPVYLLKQAFAGSLPTALGIAAHYKIADHIEKLGGKASISELAQLAGTNMSKLGSVLRALAQHHIFAEVSYDEFTNNRHSKLLATAPEAESMLELYSLTAGKALHGLLEVMQDLIAMNGIGGDYSGFTKAYPEGMPITEWIVQPQNQNSLSLLINGIPWLTKATAGAIIARVPWERFGAEPTICDMGCADGGVMALLKKSKPEIKVILQDLSSTLPMVRQTVSGIIPLAIEGQDFEIQEHDYFTLQKTHADVYWMRGVLCEYADDKCLQILEGLRDQLKSASNVRVLINEVVVPGLANDGAQLRQSMFPEMSSLMQLHSTSFLGVRERTYQEFEALFHRAGYRITAFYDIHLYTSLFEITLS